jgi:anti-sigma regulatory factor (Ser/Thr protein kinase)
MKRLDITPLTHWITAAAAANPGDLPAHLMQRLSISRRRAGSLLKQLEAAQWLVREGTPRRPRWRAGPLRQVVQTYAIAGLMEDEPWRRDFAPHFELPAHVRRMAQHTFTELLNNAIEHSGGHVVTVSMRQTPLQMQLLISDDGCGLFERIARSFAIDEPQLAMLELSKGKLTSAPERHAGHGLFFSAALADVIDVQANGVSYQRRAWQPGQWHAGRRGAAVAERPGTSIYLAINLATERTLESVLHAHSDSGSGLDFSRTRVPLALLTSPAVDPGRDRSEGLSLVSRAEARRAIARLAQFARAELDFSGITHVGHGFADELLRVARREQPQLELIAVGAAPQVAAMLDAVSA